MRVGAFELKEPLPELREPYAFASLRPWVDVGSVGTITLAWLEMSFGAEEIGRLARPGTFFDFTRYRPTLYRPEGRREVIVPNSLIRAASGSGEHDLLFLHLLEPHSLGEAYVGSVLKLLKKFGVKKYCLLGSMYDVVPHTRPLRVTGTTTEAETQARLKALGIQASDYQGPTTILYLLTQETPTLHLETTSLIVHLPQYAQLEEDYKGQMRLLEVITPLYGFTLKLGDLGEKGERQYRELSQAVERNPEVKAVVEQLEALYDSQARRREEGKEPYRLSPEIEYFLREINQRFGQQP